MRNQLLTINIRQGNIFSDRVIYVFRFGGVGRYAILNLPDYTYIHVCREELFYTKPTKHFLYSKMIRLYINFV